MALEIPALINIPQHLIQLVNAAAVLLEALVQIVMAKYNGMQAFQLVLL